MCFQDVLQPNTQHVPTLHTCGVAPLLGAGLLLAGAAGLGVTATGVLEMLLSLLNWFLDSEGQASAAEVAAATVPAIPVVQAAGQHTDRHVPEVRLVC